LITVLRCTVYGKVRLIKGSLLSVQPFPRKENHLTFGVTQIVETERDALPNTIPVFGTLKKPK
jgi:hypothetical protein